MLFSPDGGTLASGGEDGTIKLWDAARGEVLRTLGPLSRLPEALPGDALWFGIRWLGGALAVVLLGFGLSGRRSAARPEAVPVLTALLLVPLLLPWLVSLVWQPADYFLA